MNNVGSKAKGVIISGVRKGIASCLILGAGVLALLASRSAVNESVSVDVSGAGQQSNALFSGAGFSGESKGSATAPFATQISGAGEVETTSSDWQDLPNLSATTNVGTGGDLAITVCAEVAVTNHRMFVRALIDGAPANPDDVLFTTLPHLESHCFTFVRNAVPAGAHDVRIQWAVDEGMTGRAGVRSLNVTKIIADELRLMAVAAPSGLNVPVPPDWTDIPDLSGTIKLAGTSDLAITFSGEIVSRDARLFIRALIRRSDQAEPNPAQPDDELLLDQRDQSVRTFTFVMPGLTAGSYEITLQARADGEGIAAIGDRTLAAVGLKHTGTSRVSGLVVAAPSGSDVLTKSSAWVDMPDLQGTLDLPSNGDVAIGFSAEDGGNADGASTFVRALVDGRATSAVRLTSDARFNTGAFTWIVTNLQEGTSHEIKIQWRSDLGSPGTAVVGDRTLTAYTTETATAASVPGTVLTVTPTPVGGTTPLSVTFAEADSNVGSDAISAVNVVDESCSPLTLIEGDANADGILDPGEIWHYRCTQTFDQPGTFTNHVSATGTNVVTGESAPEETAHATVVVVLPTSHTSLSVVASPSRGVAPLEVTYTYQERNDGRVPIANVRVSDDVCSPLSRTGGDTNGNDVLDPGETWHFICTHTFREAGPFTNHAIATGTDTNTGAPAPAERASISVTVAKPPPPPPPCPPRPVINAGPFVNTMATEWSREPLTTRGERRVEWTPTGITVTGPTGTLPIPNAGGYTSRYMFIGSNNHVLILHQETNQGPINRMVTVINFCTTPPSETQVLFVASSSELGLPNIQWSQGTGDAFFIFAPVPGPLTQADGIAIYRSADGKSLCGGVPPFSPQGQLNAAATDTQLLIKVGSTVLNACNKPP